MELMQDAVSQQSDLWGNLSSRAGCLIVKWGLVLICPSVPCEHFFFHKESASPSANPTAFPSKLLSAKSILKMLTCLLSCSFEQCTGDAQPGMPGAFCEAFPTRAGAAGDVPGLGLHPPEQLSPAQQGKRILSGYWS